ncbi:uncharacterized protein LOC113383609 [Ctenocephalides felis]|uniref:uncharacterized protein LOC113383609 n=1 Tax=Ctenocephalides felis TaxID=7515 RepID=UPI000E6E24EC|nr:uncharacterized protein LOC113383609 [Ctenocephalides felis]
MSASSVNNILQISLCILLFLRPIFANEHCIQDRNCRCVYESGRGLDLNKKFASDDYILSASLNNLTYYFHACKDVHTLPISPNDLNKTANGCYNEKDGYSMCVFNKTNQSYEKLGTSREAQFTPSDVNEINYMRYKHGNSAAVAILLICVPDIAETHLLAISNSNNVHNLILYTPAACIHEIIVPGLGGFAVFIILLISGILAYLFVGILVNRLALGARGIEMIPNLSFWRSVPSRCGACIDFCRHGYQRRSDTQNLNPDTYDAI